ncbi:MAG: tRNA uridine-5-carboxymethylaminomethyl(34) synthesis enzyme MnmG [Planctomycetota bacterium]
MDRVRYEVVVIGGGHAGVEAAWACANLLGEPGSVALVTLDPAKIGVMSCNPAIGGLAKGQLVREVDAMGGLMGLAADASGINFKVLNTSKGPAVRGPRCQCDKHAYAETVRALIASRPEIEVIAGAVDSFAIDKGELKGLRVRTADGDRTLASQSVVLTTGTFMRGLMHTGERRTPGGRHGEAAASGISGALKMFGFELGRLKTGTPPRLDRQTIEWEQLPAQIGDAQPVPFSDLTSAGSWQAGAARLHRFPNLDQVECRETTTTPEVHTFIRENIHRAPMFSGQIESAGPRYCPSIEDKVVRFADREQHGVFLEPESLRDDVVYCNGIATSTPEDVQHEIVRWMPGCANARILVYGYAVEYDSVLPHQIRATGETKAVPGLYLAGQINGTSGYEEAAAQGLIAGINAAHRALGLDEFTLARDQAYAGVLMDDLVTSTPTEPYRMFTSRAEHRLLLRADNTADRLTPIAKSLGLLSTSELGRQRLAAFARRTDELTLIKRAIDATRVDGMQLDKVIRRPGFEVNDLAEAIDGDRFSRESLFTAHADRRYEPYVQKQQAEVRRQRASEGRRLPVWLNPGEVEGLRAEAREALLRFTPSTFGQAGRLAGVTPADLTLLAIAAKRGPRDRAVS